MRTPDENHPITIRPVAGRVVVKVGETVLVSTRDALELREAAYPPVLYLPRGDAEMDLLEPSALRTSCPYKGEASYFGLRVGSALIKDAVWSYERPYPAVAGIAGRLAFYPQHVVIETTPEERR
ncbi:DUF427 domain-containing protein [Chelatococcus sambhunathii]|uniref:DUF427 domain-containing protein n=1 Tax=Chelatococcus sambhunathii TaxID=363953 RepID=A0ABU1DG39_9HYPH|nr:DUF427 domain-containing protein [Chelatococcus sambhunathii]MDR4307067.1 DUF427 domain-containing protein [Chelatococcus sambhunathii]